MTKSIEENAAEMASMMAEARAAQHQLDLDTAKAFARIVADLADKPEMHDVVLALYKARGLLTDAVAGNVPKPSAMAAAAAAMLEALGH